MARRLSSTAMAWLGAALLGLSVPCYAIAYNAQDDRLAAVTALLGLVAALLAAGFFAAHLRRFVREMAAQDGPPSALRLWAFPACLGAVVGGGTAALVVGTHVDLTDLWPAGLCLVTILFLTLVDRGWRWLRESRAARQPLV